MRKLCQIVMSLTLVYAFAGYAQQHLVMPLAVEEQSLAKSYPLRGSHLLEKEMQSVREYMAQHPDMQAHMRRQKASVWNFKVGDAKSWYAVDFTTSQNYLVASTCRAVGANCYLFVENTIWINKVSQRAVDSVRIAFDQRTPAFKNKGVYQADVEAFGAPPDVDNDPKIIIFILDIKDGFSGSGGFIQGYFSPRDQTTLAQSNQAEIYYLDANPTDLSDDGGIQDAMQTTAHEFQHMIHYRYDSGELTFLNEGCSSLAEVHCGYPIYNQSLFANEPNRSLLSFRSNTDANVPRDYSRSARYMTYLRDQFGIQFFKPFVQSGLRGIDGIDAALQSVGARLRFNDIFANWAIANILDDRNVNINYGYLNPNLPKAVGVVHINPNVPSTLRTIQSLGAEYISFRGGAQLQATFITTSPLVLIKAVEIGPSNKRVLDVTPGTLFSEPGYGTAFTEIHFVVYNLDRSSPYNYSYQATGVAKPLELKWDTTEPTGFLRLAASDTMCVTFDAVAGGKLDSIRVALRRAGSISGGVWEFTNSLRPTPLGKKLAVPIIATSNITPPVVNPQGPYPYPIPYPGWRKIDLTSFKISTDKAFAVAFVLAGDPTNANNTTVLSTPYPSQSAYHSFAYLHSPGSGAPDWYYLSADENNVWIYLIRAYVSFTTEKTIELLPSKFSLAQNYPNPFSPLGRGTFGNPSTTIEFELPRTSHVALKVFNALGEEVATLLSEKRAAGKYQVPWNAKNLPSGLYFYRLEGDGFVETKKLTLMK